MSQSLEHNGCLSPFIILWNDSVGRLFHEGQVEHVSGEIVCWVDERWPEVGDYIIGKKEMRFLRADLLCL